MTHEHTHTEEITKPRHTYTIRMGGTLDEFNTFEYGRQIAWKFQPNISFTMENSGNSVVRGPRIVINGRRNWYSIDHILGEIISPDMTDEEKTFAVWNFVRTNVQEGHTYNSIIWGEDGSITRFLNAVGTGACGTFHGVTPLLLARAGVELVPPLFQKSIVDDVIVAGELSVLSRLIAALLGVYALEAGIRMADNYLRHALGEVTKGDHT